MIVLKNYLKQLTIILTKMDNKFSFITDEELILRAERLTSKADGLRANILKECDMLESMYLQLIDIKRELESRKRKLNGEDE